MNNDLNIEYFDTLRKSLKDAARTALMNAKSESQDNDHDIIPNKSDFDYRIPFKKNSITEIAFLL